MDRALTLPRFLTRIGAWKGWRGLVRDAHFYGGLVLAGCGLGCWLHPGLGMAAAGAGLFYVALPRRGAA